MTVPVQYVFEPDARRDALYVTTTASLYPIRTTVRGLESPPGK
jgi:hypothetical protein